MALPSNVLSTAVISAPLVAPRGWSRSAVLCYELGGVALNDASQGLQTKVWTGRYTGTDITLEAPGVSPVVVASPGAGMLDFDFTFDRNMNYFVCWENPIGTVSYKWFDSLASAFVTSTLPAGSISPRCSLDDKRVSQDATSDIIFAYVRANTLYYRQQRDRYLTERSLTTVPNGRLMYLGMHERWRMQFVFQPDGT